MKIVFFAVLIISLFTLKTFAQESVAEYQNSDGIFKLFKTIMPNKGLTDFELKKTSADDTINYEILWKITLSGYYYQSLISDKTISTVTINCKAEKTKFNLFVFKCDSNNEWHLFVDFSFSISLMKLQFWGVTLLNGNMLSVEPNIKKQNFKEDENILMDCKNENAPYVYIISDEGYVKKYVMESIKYLELNDDLENKRSGSAKLSDFLNKPKEKIENNPQGK